MELNEIKDLPGFRITCPEWQRGTQIYLVPPSFVSCLISLASHLYLPGFVCRVIDPLAFQPPFGIAVSTNQPPGSVGFLEIRLRQKVS
jgi:hypothetical protein